MDTTVIYGVAAVPAIVGLVQVAKDMGLDARFAPALAVLIGILAALGQVIGANLALSAPHIVTALFTGISFGLSASGLYAGAKTITAHTTAPVTQPTPIKG